MKSLVCSEMFYAREFLFRFTRISILYFLEQNQLWCLRILLKTKRIFSLKVRGDSQKSVVYTMQQEPLMVTETQLLF